MTREQLEHLIRAASVIADDDTIVVIGSQAILGQFPDAPESMRVSAEADLFPCIIPNAPTSSKAASGSSPPSMTLSATTPRVSPKRPPFCRKVGKSASSSS